MVKVLFFAQLKDVVGVGEALISLSTESISIHQLVKQICESNQVELGSLLNPNIKFALNQQIVDQQAMLNDGDELALFPPVTGG